LSSIDSDCVHLVQGPLYHAGPLGNAVNSLLVGASVYIMKKFDPEKLLQNIEAYKITHTMMVPTMFVRLLKLPVELRNKYDISSLSRVHHIAAPMPVHVKRKMIDWWGPILIDAYGSSEIGVITRIVSEEWMKKPGSVGRPVSGFTLQIVGDDGEEVPTGEIGKIYATSSTDVDLEYLDDPERTAEAHRLDKQFTIGDMGWLDEDGYLYLSDRRADMILSGGTNIYPAEIESVLIEHASVEDVCVFGVPNAEWGQEVKAAIKLSVDVLASEELREEILIWAQGNMAKFKVPNTIDFMEDLPRYPNGKMHRRELRDRYWPQSAA
jgi:long-chain acyl-CoA synthetase